jgi:hypothetical protein
VATEQWIVVPRWHEFQHYRDRDPNWIKNYRVLLSDDDYLALSGHTRAILHGLWLAYASSDGQLRLDSLSLSRRLALRVTMKQIESLNHAGFIQFSASRPLALRYQAASLEKRREEKIKEEGLLALSNVVALDSSKPLDSSHEEVQKLIEESLA